jgi:hypothetical protein
MQAVSLGCLTELKDNAYSLQRSTGIVLRKAASLIYSLFLGLAQPHQAQKNHIKIT